MVLYRCKELALLLIILLFATTGCDEGKSGNESDAFITIDVTKSYPKKELILQDFMDVEYIPLETTYEFLCQGRVLAVGNEIILVRNQVNDGNIYIFDKNGKGLRKINRLGRGGEEYTDISGVILDEDNSEIFVNNMSANRIMVYDLYGNFKRSLRYNEGVRHQYFFNFDRESIICEDLTHRVDAETPDKSPFLIISKQDCSIIKEINVPYEKKKSTIFTTRVEIDGMSIPVGTSYMFLPIIPHYYDGWVLTEPSSDTLYILSSNKNMLPFIARTPSIQSMTVEVFLFPRLISDRYYFIETVRKEYDFSTTHLVYDRQENRIFEYTVYNDDFSPKRPVDISSQQPINNEIALWVRLEADDLFDAYHEGQLKGSLKDIAAGLKEEDNPVIMIVKHKR